jgi:hypothetical protein
MVKNDAKPSMRVVCHITVPLCHIKATTRTVSTGKNSPFSRKNAREIFWQAVSGNLHFRQGIAAKYKTKSSRTTRKLACITLVDWQGIMAKLADNYGKAQSLPTPTPWT